jgi:hypothetical protein
MHVIVATDGSRQSLAAAKHLKSFADPTKVTDISVVAVIRPLASVAFADDTSERKWPSDGSFRDAAQSAVDNVAAVFDGWGPKVHKRIRSGRSRPERRRAGGQHRPARPALRAVPGPRRTPRAPEEEVARRRP